MDVATGVRLDKGLMARTSGKCNKTGVDLVVGD